MMLSDIYIKTEKNLIGEVWQNSRIYENMLILSDENGSRFAGAPS